MSTPPNNNMSSEQQQQLQKATTTTRENNNNGTRLEKDNVPIFWSRFYLYFSQRCPFLLVFSAFLNTL